MEKGNGQLWSRFFKASFFKKISETPYGCRNTEYFLGGLSAFWHKYSVFRRNQFLEPYGNIGSWRNILIWRCLHSYNISKKPWWKEHHCLLELPLYSAPCSFSSSLRLTQSQWYSLLHEKHQKDVKLDSDMTFDILSPSWLLSFVVTGDSKIFLLLRMSKVMSESNFTFLIEKRETELNYSSSSRKSQTWWEWARSTVWR